MAAFKDEKKNNRLTDIIAKEIINQSNISLDDIKFIYDNWDLIIEITNRIE